MLGLSEKPTAAEGVAQVIASNFDLLPPNIRNKLYELAKMQETAKKVVIGVGQTLARSCCRLPDQVMDKLLISLSEKDKAAEDIVWMIVAVFAKLPKQSARILLKLSERDEIAPDIPWAIYVNFDTIPDEVRNELLLKLSKKDVASKHDDSVLAWGLAWVVEANFRRLPEKVRNEVLLKLSEKKAVSDDVIKIIKKNYKKLPEEVRRLLQT